MLCLKNEELVLAVEVKDQQLTLDARPGQAQARASQGRPGAALMSLSNKSAAEKRANRAFDQLVEKEFASGHDVYVARACAELAEGLLALLGEQVTSAPFCARSAAQRSMPMAPLGARHGDVG